nr:tyrosine-type recombinase/integrase [Dietzia sp. SLG310A2-38A2]
MASSSWSTETRRAFRSTVRVFFRWAHKHRGYRENPADDLPPIRPHVPIPRAASDETVEAALTLADPRTDLMIRLAAFMGLRRAEVAQVHSRDVLTDEAGQLSLVVHGKGRRQRVVPVPGDLVPDLGAFTGWLFPSVMGGHLSESSVGDLVGDCLPAGVTMHCLRHRFATKCYTASSDLIATQTLLGHSKPETTRRYVKFDDSGLRGVVDAAASLA